MDMTIYSKFVAAEMEQNPDGSQPTGYTALTLTKTAHRVATISGDIEPIDLGFGVTGIKVAGIQHNPHLGGLTLSQAIYAARNNELGLSIK